MSSKFNSDSDDDDDLHHSSSLLQTQNFNKFGTKDFRITQTKSKNNDGSNFNLDLHKVTADDNDSLNDSDDDTNSKTGRSTSSATTSQLTPKPKERSFMKSNAQKPAVKPRGIINDDDDDRNVFGKTITKSSSKPDILTLREEEERDQSFIKGFSNEQKQKSTSDIFSTNRKFTKKTSSKSEFDSDDNESVHSKSKDVQSNRHSPINNNERSHSRRSSNKNKDDTDQSDNENLIQPMHKQFNSDYIQHTKTSSRPSSANKKEVESQRRPSYSEDQDTVIPQQQSRPTSAKSHTTRQQTESAINAITFANTPATQDLLTSNNETLAATLQPPSPPPISTSSLPPTAKLPPRPKPSSNTMTRGGGINKNTKYKVPARYIEISSKIDNGRTPTSDQELAKSINRALAKELKTKLSQRPQTARIRKQSANNNSNENQRRRRSSSAYEDVKPRINTNLSINFDDIDTNKMLADSSQSIKDGVFLEWVKTKYEQKKQEKEDLNRWKEESTKNIDRSKAEQKIRMDAKNLDQWRKQRDDEIKQKRREEIQIKREEENKKKLDRQKKIDDAKLGFEQWTDKKKENDGQKKVEDERKNKEEFEKREEDKRTRVKEAEKAYDRWNESKKKQIENEKKAKKTVRQEKLKTVRTTEENKFISGQEAYENWINKKEKDDVEKRRNSMQNSSFLMQQKQMPFLPGGAQRNTGKILHNPW